ncbi:PRC-barrel domain-containing protein [uncultured Desulfuromusa sp.]|uniref:PRC-barrel domain-containing protein n=1 Tax=uncultured Desulfuromusa sp. TaxID=219183 RepID=UPI002AA8B64F|nr:PRC-barrel domain-containing protein [uncultured Desulfuromusa sp.]
MSGLRKLSDLTGYGFLAQDAEVGRLEEIYFDDHYWHARYLVVKTGNWLLGRRVLLVPEVIEGIDDEEKNLWVNLTRQQIENAPPIDSEQPVSWTYQQQYYRYYDRDPYWITDSLFNSTPAIPPFVQPDETIKKPENPHLRSSSEVTGYRLSAEDGDVGHVEDFIFDEQSWALRYLEIDTRNWLPGRHVLISPAWVEEVDWATQQVKVAVSRDLVNNAPEYDSSKHISREYQLALYKHYGKSFSEE